MKRPVFVTISTYREVSYEYIFSAIGGCYINENLCLSCGSINSDRFLDW
jgi:hypothetical protein